AYPGSTHIGGPVIGPFPSLVLAPGVTLDVAGSWVNDTPLLPGADTLPLFTSGGTVSLVGTDASVVVPGSVTVDASGGAQRTMTGALVAGNGGAISLTANQPQTDQPSLQLTVDGRLQAYALSNGGSLSLSLPRLCVSSLQCADTVNFRIDPFVFTNDAIGQVTLNPNNGSLTVG